MELWNERTRRIAAWALFVLAIAYAFVAGLRTVTDFDMGWMLAYGRQLVSQHQIPRTEFLSYTAYGTPWIYPSFGGALLYAAYALGGFGALSWINALAAAAVVSIAVRRPRIVPCTLAILAVPSIALRTAPRAELFTTLFFTAFLVLLWKQLRGEKSQLWLLPLMMVGWVNAHPGFAAGLVLLCVYVAMELEQCCFASQRVAAMQRLRSAAPWLGLTVLATFVNPWGIKVYEGLVAQKNVTALLNVSIGEWTGGRFTLGTIAGALQLRDPNSSYWWLLAGAFLIAVAALWKRQFSSAVLLTTAAYFSIEHLRFQALFAILLIVIAADVMERPSPSETKATKASGYAQAAVFAAAVCIAALHIADTITNYSYLANGELSLFGPGLSWWYPQRAAQFIENNALPGNLFNDFNSGGYLVFRLGPRYRDFADGRIIPFGAGILAQQTALVQSPPDSPQWIQEADRRGINTIILSIARFGGLESVPLRDYCESREWKPVYLDDVSIVLVRNLPQNHPWLSRFAIDCAHDPIAPPAADPQTTRGRAELYNFYANAASIYYVLGRDADAAESIARAEQLFAGDANLAVLEGQLLQANGKLAQAEAQYRRALAMRPTDNAWYLLARLFIEEKRYPEAAWAVQHSADLASMPAERYRLLGNLQLAMNKPADAFPAFDRAEHYGEKLAPLPSYPAFRAKVAEGRGRAWLALHDAKRATGYAEQATQLAPEPQRWNLLAECYDAEGRTVDAAQARSRAMVAPQKSASGSAQK